MRVSPLPSGFEDGEPTSRPVSRPVFLPALDAAVHGLPTLRTTFMGKRGVLRLHLEAHHTPRLTVTHTHFYKRMKKCDDLTDTIDDAFGETEFPFCFSLG